MPADRRCVPILRPPALPVPDDSGQTGAVTGPRLYVQWRCERPLIANFANFAIGCLQHLQLAVREMEKCRLTPRASGSTNPQKSPLPSVGPYALPLSARSSHGAIVAAIGVKRLRPISRDVRRRTEVNRDLLYEPDEHLKRDAEFPPMRGKRVAERSETLSG